MAKKTKYSKIKNFFASLFCLIVGLSVGFVLECYVSLPDSYSIPETITSSSVASGIADSETITSSEMSIHFLELGNKYTGDCTLIKVGNTEMLIDAGSKTSSLETIYNYVSSYCTDGVLEYVIVTHAHEDHYACFATSKYEDSLFSKFEIGKIIYFSNTNKSSSNKMYSYFVSNLETVCENDGTEAYTATECLTTTFSLSDTEANSGTDYEDLNIYFTVLNQKFYTSSSSTENNYSVCLEIAQETSPEEYKYFLFTGDLESDGEESLTQKNSLHQVELYKAGHHGSKTSSSETLLAIIQPKVVCVCCCAGSSEYTSKNENQFPTQEFIDRVGVYTDKIYVTTLCTDYSAGTFESMNGNIVVCSNASESSVSVFCTNSTTILKDTEWFKANRTWNGVSQTE